MVCDVVARGARQLGRPDHDASAFAREVEQAFRASLGVRPGRGSVSIAINSAAGSLQVVVVGDRDREPLVISERR